MEIVLLAAIGWTEVLLIVLVVLLLFGATKIPQMMRGLGQGVSEFKKGIREGDTKPEEQDKTAPPNQTQQKS